MSQYATSYISEISEQYKTGRAGEHAYRPALAKFIKSLDPKLGVVNDPKRTEYGAPDFIFVKGELIAGYAETKDIDVDLDKTVKTEQLERYFGYSNLILTNYLEFRFFRNGQLYGDPIILGEIKGDTVKIIDETTGTLETAIKDFLTAQPEAIKSGVRLAKIMGGKARRIRDNVKQFLVKESNDENKELVRVYETIQQLLVHDLDSAAFADMYAQTLVYGLFVARYYDESPANFTRQEARDLIPASNPFLRHFFDHIAGADFDQRLAYIANELCEVFQVADVQQLMGQYFKKDKYGEDISGPDPVIHFYEDFLKEYDPALRKKMGAYYTPLPVVRFIVKAVDDILQKEFKLTDGLANTSKLANGFHRVQVLDPAVGTGTFISAVIRKIYERFQGPQKGRWPTYVHNELLPRIYGFELMMASYTIAHLKLSMAFKETGFWKFHRRLGIYLTNSLEEAGTQKDLFSAFGLAQSITEEAKEATKIKNDKPIMVVVGNPPYSVSSSNKSEWILNLIKDYKKDLGERKINLDDDYIKFIRFAEHFIEKNKTGIVAMITNNSFIDGITHRQMRKHLLETFDEIYILDLHGNFKKKEKAPDGGKDENVFDIQQGVSINIFVRKNENKTGLGVVYHSEVFGNRESKFEMLNKSDIEKIKWQKLNYSEPYFFFVPKDFGENIEYEKGFKVDEVFLENAMGIVTGIDKLSIFQTKDELEKTTRSILNSDDPYREFNIKDGRKYKKEERLKELRDMSVNEPTKVSYRPFDTRYMYYTQKSECWINSPRLDIMSNFTKENLGFCAVRAGRNADYHNYYVVNHITDKSIVSSLDNANIFPLYLYQEGGTKSPNLKKKIVDEIEKVVDKVSPEDIFDYIYAILYSPNYREKYKEFLKIDFPRVPYPKNKETFKKLVSFGTELRQLHLLESPKVNKFITSYPEDGSNLVEKITYKDGKVFINAQQYFGGVSEIVWNFWIGGYQPVQKWLKDRKGRTLTNEDIEHYQKMIVALAETDRIIKEIDRIVTY
jgi:type I restriction-modification system DNA methylase subunit